MLALGGAAGTLCRYGLSGLAHRLLGESFPFGTFFVNILGCFLFGLVFGLLEARGAPGAQARILLLTGFMGAFTTFSTYIYESAAMARLGEWLPLVLNLAGQVAVGLAFLFIGLAAAKTLAEVWT
jgi:CrcB protein